MAKHHVRTAAWLFVIASLLGAPPAVAAQPEDSADTAPWSEVVDGEVVVDLYFVWSSTCPHCREAHPFVAGLEEQYPWLRVHWLQVDGSDPQAVETAIALADSIDQIIRGVPAFMWCGRLASGYDDADGVGAHLESELLACRAALGPISPAPEPTPLDETDTVAVPIVGDVDATTVSLPTFTVMIAAVDAFNPCAFFVLLFLLSLLVHARSRLRMAVIGGTFVLVSGLIYFAFMAAWLSFFQVTENIRGITFAAGLVALAIAALNLKDALGSRRGPSLSIPERAKPGLYARMRGLVAADRYPAMLVGTVALAVAVNSYELLCTAGLPMAYTHVLTLNELSTSTYYLYLALYNVVYMVPLLLIVGGFVFALGSRKLQEYEGRALKLMSGTMMGGLGGILVFAPDTLGDPWAAIIVILVAIGVAAVAALIQRRSAGHVAIR